MQATYGLNDESTGDLCECLLAILIFGKPEGAVREALDAFEQYFYAYSRYVWKRFEGYTDDWPNLAKGLKAIRDGAAMLAEIPKDIANA